MNQIKNLALRAAAAAGMLGASVSNALAAITDLVPNETVTNISTFEEKVISVSKAFVGVVALVSVVMLVYGAYLFVTAGANEDSAKKGKTVIVYAIIGIIIGALVFAIVNVAVSLIS